MKVTFIYTDYGRFNQKSFNRGVAILSSCLKQAGREVSLIHIYKPIDKKTFLTLVKMHNPDLIAFSFISNMFSQVKRFALWIKELNIPTLAGGLHPSIAPEECLSQEGIEAICRGEGEAALVDFCRAIESSSGIKNIPNIWVKAGGHIYKNPCRDLIENLDSLPFPDYKLFHYENLEESKFHKVLVSQASRGCNFNCTYCCNSTLRSLYSNQGHYLRYYSVERLLDEVQWALKKYPFLKEVRFYDDTLMQDKHWFGEFASKYRQRIGLPFSCNERVENINLETIAQLKESGCTSIDLGIESGSQYIREKFMNRRMPDEKIKQAFSLLRSSGIRVNSFNILGMVGETPETILKTIKLNALVKPCIVFNAYFYPFKSTGAYELVRERGYRVREDVGSFFERPVVNLDTISESQLEFFYKYFYFLMRLYNILWNKFGRETKTVRILDRIITSKFFPYFIFNFIHFGKEDALAFLRRYPSLYLVFRKIYRLIKGEKD